MEPILSKQEIADLLSTLKTTGSQTGDSFDSASGIDSPGYVDIDLFHRYSEFREPQAIPNFDLVMDLFAEYFSLSLSQALQCTVNAAATKLSYQRFNTYLLSEPNPCAIGVIKADPLNYGGIITLSPKLAFSLIEILLGGTPHPDGPQPDRSATRLELSVLESVLTLGCHSFQRAMIPVVEVHADLVKTTHDLRLVSLVAPDAEIAVCTFNVQSDSFSESMHLVFPTAAFTSFRQFFENLLNMDELTDTHWQAPVSAHLDSIRCTVMARTELIEMTIRDFISLKTGDTLPLTRSPGASLDLLVEGKVKFSGIQMEKDRKRHVRITDISD